VGAALARVKFGCSQLCLNPSDSDGDQVDDASFFLAPSTSGADFYHTRGHPSPASSRSSKRDELEDDEEMKKVSFNLVLCLFQKN